MTYNELLQQKEWWQKCNEILNRGKRVCCPLSLRKWNKGIVDMLFTQ